MPRDGGQAQPPGGLGHQQAADEQLAVSGEVEGDAVLAAHDARPQVLRRVPVKKEAAGHEDIDDDAE